jgi:hypothetical protein
VVIYVETFKTVVTGQDQREIVEITDKKNYIRISLLHLNTLYRFRSNQYLLLLLNATC